MTRQEKGLWTAVIVLTLGMLVMGSVMVVQGLRTGREEGELPHDSGQEEGSAVATINGEVITDKEWTDALKKRYGSELLLQMLNRKAVYAEAVARNLTVSPKEIAKELHNAMDGYDSEQSYYDEMQSQLGLSRQDLELEAGYRLLLEKIATSSIQIKDSDIERYWNEHREDYVSPEKYDLSMIVVKDEREADSLLEALENGADFEQIARVESIDSFSRDLGGKLGWIEQNDPFQPEEVLNLAGQLEIGDIAGPVDIQEGYAIIKLNDIQERQEQSAEEAHEEIRMQLALSQADPLPQVEERLRDKYEAVVVSDIPAS
ncbi:peptidyl-prolyl cis-trans isomerase [Paenibacillus sp. MER 99-2]|uniref:peptidyl-prolyl cis-trans isomerase n=1 Tax=Paenibacillus sp. MER 99-2 TaxID=2939572 RepID=UPI0020424AD0|nr:peptidyl-prolyl cis-trans isomerase [Paenibacillus sp. MER 99-2]MCM3175962.1 peptidyl-prolyl cis-trans isomerase [Paenibacillus sp. MER 99-2]